MTKIKLLQAEKTTIQLFEAVEQSNLIVAGKSEEALNAEVYKLAFETFGIKKHWHKKLVRSGVNTLATYNENPPNQILQDDDILFIDYGPIVDGYEADLGRTYVIGNNVKKIKLKYDVEKAWFEIKEWFEAQNKLKASELFQFAVEKAAQYGWEFGGEIAGHIVGEFPHEQPLDPASFELDVHPENHNDMFLPDSNGNKRHWILELQFIDRENSIGSYFEQLLC
ncbi:MAG: M24 family metallopeptidase [Ferruginibacter sp.]